MSNFKFLISNFFILCFVFLVFVTKQAFAQNTSSGIGIPTIVNSDNVTDGALVCSTSSGYVLCNLTYDAGIYGVVSVNPSANIGKTGENREYYVVHSGVASVQVSTQNGNIAEGNLLTSSDVAGVAVKATNNGYVLGTSLGTYNETDPKKVGQVYVSLNIHPTVAFANTRSNLFQLLRQGVSASLLTPLAAFRYILAALVTLVSFILGFVFFGRLAKTGVEAIGRNPLAQRRIEFTVLLHILITFAIFVLGVFLAYLILVI